MKVKLLWLWAASYDYMNSTHIRLHLNDITRSVRKQITLIKLFINYADNSYITYGSYTWHNTVFEFTLPGFKILEYLSRLICSSK